MEKKKFYYVVVSFMRSDRKDTKAMLPVTVSVSEEDNPSLLLPIAKLIRYVEEHYKDAAIPSTILIENVVEITEGDYKSYDAWACRFGRTIFND